MVNAEVLDPNFNPMPFSAAVPNPSTRTNFSPRVDWQLTPSNTLTLRYRFVESNRPTAASGNSIWLRRDTTKPKPRNVIQAVDNQMISPTIVNETRFQFTRDQHSQIRQNFRRPFPFSARSTMAETIRARSSTRRHLRDPELHFEFRRQAFQLKFGGGFARLPPYTTIANSILQRHFHIWLPHVSGPEDLLASTGILKSPSKVSRMASRYPQIQALGGGPSQFLINAGTPLLDLSQFDLGLYVQDNWRLRPNMTVNMGLRFETQDNIHDHADFAPRLGFAWGLGGKKGVAPKTVVRAGFGFFYDRFNDDYVLQAERQNGINQQQYIINTPNFYPTIPVDRHHRRQLPKHSDNLPGRSHSARAVHHPNRGEH